MKRNAHRCIDFKQLIMSENDIAENLSDNSDLCDTYFLTPVNEYNIVDKIQTANSLLFASIEGDGSTTDTDLNNAIIKMDEMKLQSSHRVTFSSDIEEFDDEEIMMEETERYCQDDDEIDKEIIEIIERDENRIESEIKFDTKVDVVSKRTDTDISKDSDDSECSNTVDYVTEIENNGEIYEEIIEIADKVETYLDDIPDECILEDVIQAEMSDIVIEKTNFIQINQTETDNKDIEENQKSFSNFSPIASELKRKQKPFLTRKQINKNFSKELLSLAKAKTCPVLKANDKQNTKLHKSQSQRKFSDSEAILKIHLNIKECCEFKYLENDRLPRYNGYVSQYGLSKDQLERREKNRRNSLQKQEEKRMQIKEAKTTKSETNEQAFCQWLHRKNKTKQIKSKNMYDSNSLSRK